MNRKLHSFFDPTIGADSPNPGLDLEFDASNLPDLTDDTLKQERLERASTIPSSWYTHSSFHAFDIHSVFSTTWQYVGHESRIPEPGDYLSETVGGNPLIIIRADDGSLKAFYNVCRHRGGPLTMQACGSAKVLQCKYHGWTYLLDDSLRGVPRFNRTDLFDKRDFGLVPVAVESWADLVFVCLVPTRSLSVREQMKEFDKRIRPMSITDKHYHGREIYELACNWKVYVDNYLEGYHIPLVHPDLCDLLDYRSYVTEISPYYSLQYSPLKSEGHIHNAGSGDVFYFFVYPNFMMNILPGRLQINRVVATGYRSCRVIFDYYYDRLQTEEARQMIEEDYSFSRQVQEEDIEICEYVQRGLESNAYDRGRFSVDAEKGVHHFQSLLKDSYRNALGRSG